MIYRLLFRLVLARLDAETAHGLAARMLWAGRLLRPVRDPVLAVEAFGRELRSPFGLAAGFDKDAKRVDALLGLGFGFVEVGTVTSVPQPGNPRPRLFRLVEDRALLNRMGFNNDGAQATAERLARRGRGRGLRRGRRGGPAGAVGVNIGKAKAVAAADAPADYRACAEAVAAHADYLVLNVSSPNTPGLRDLQAVESLGPLVLAVREAAPDVPLLVKIAPDLADEDVDRVADLALELGVDGLIATNTTVARDGLRADRARVEALGAGGISGAPLRERSLEVLRRLRARVGEQVLLVSVGGVQDADDVWERLQAGATLVQAYTGFVYGGPLWPRKVQRELGRRVRAEGLATVGDAIGAGAAQNAAKSGHFASARDA